MLESEYVNLIQFALNGKSKYFIYLDLHFCLECLQISLDSTLVGQQQI